MQACLTDGCNQGRRACPTPLTCSGAAEEVEAAVRYWRPVITTSGAPVSVRFDAVVPEPDPDFSSEAVMSKWPLWLLALVAVFLLITVLAFAAGYSTAR
jgi:hypothetical protein